MELATQVEILDKAVYVSLHTNALRKAIDFLTPSDG